MAKRKIGLYVEQGADELRLVITFDQGASQGEVVVPLTFSSAARLAQSIQDFLARKQANHSARLPLKILDVKTGRHNA